MFCKISSRASHRFSDHDDLVEIVPDSGCPILCISEEMAKKHGLKVPPVDSNESEITTYGGTNLTIVGQTRTFLKCVKTGALKMLNAIIIKGASKQTILLSWQDMVSWGILPLQFPYPTVEKNFVNRVYSTEDETEN